MWLVNADTIFTEVDRTGVSIITNHWSNNADTVATAVIDGTGQTVITGFCVQLMLTTQLGIARIINTRVTVITVDILTVAETGFALVVVCALVIVVTLRGRWGEDTACIGVA